MKPRVYIPLSGLAGIVLGLTPLIGHNQPEIEQATIEYTIQAPRQSYSGDTTTEQQRDTIDLRHTPLYADRRQPDHTKEKRPTAKRNKPNNSQLWHQLEDLAQQLLRVQGYDAWEMPAHPEDDGLEEDQLSASFFKTYLPKATIDLSGYSLHVRYVISIESKDTVQLLMMVVGVVPESFTVTGERIQRQMIARTISESLSIAWDYIDETINNFSETGGDITDPRNSFMWDERRIRYSDKIQDVFDMHRYRTERNEQRR